MLRLAAMVVLLTGGCLYVDSDGTGGGPPTGFTYVCQVQLWDGQETSYAEVETCAVSHAWRKVWDEFCRPMLEQNSLFQCGIDCEMSSRVPDCWTD